LRPHFIKSTGTVGGDPSFLMALAGTPLFERMQATGRLVDGKEEQGIERQKIETNIYYLLDKGFWADGFMKFIDSFNHYSFQYARFMRYIELIRDKGYYSPMDSSGYASPWPYLKLQISQKPYRKMLFKRIRYLLHPARTFILIKALVGGRVRSPQSKSDFFSVFFYWVYAWTNLALKYEGLSKEDFRLHSVDEDFDRSRLIVASNEEKIAEMENLHGIKASNQKKYTDRALLELVNKSNDASD
jgi:hypothetical protein